MAGLMQEKAVEAALPTMTAPKTSAAGRAPEADAALRFDPALGDENGWSPLDANAARPDEATELDPAQVPAQPKPAPEALRVTPDGSELLRTLVPGMLLGMQLDDRVYVVHEAELRAHWSEQAERATEVSAEAYRELDRAALSASFAEAGADALGGIERVRAGEPTFVVMRALWLAQTRRDAEVDWEAVEAALAEAAPPEVDEAPAEKEHEAAPEPLAAPLVEDLPAQQDDLAPGRAFAKIRAQYEAAHPGDRIVTDGLPLSAVAAAYYAVTPDAQARPSSGDAARERVDLLNVSAHQLYVLTWRGASLSEARARVARQADWLRMLDAKLVLGATSEPGSAGELVVGRSHFRFAAPSPGVILFDERPVESRSAPPPRPAARELSRVKPEAAARESAMPRLVRTSRLVNATIRAQLLALWQRRAHGSS